MRFALAVLLIAFASPAAAQEKMPAGRYVQTSSSAGDCSTCNVEITQIAPDLIQITANNGWSGIATYEPRSGQYMGYSQYQRGEGGDLGGPPMDVTWTYSNDVLSMRAAPPQGAIVATFRRQR